MKRFRDLSDLGDLLPESARSKPANTTKGTTHNGKGAVVHVKLDTEGRKGKTVTLVAGLQHNPQTLGEIARLLKQACGAGGTIRGMTIEIQGDQRARVAEKLRSMNYIVKEL